MPIDVSDVLAVTFKSELRLSHVLLQAPLWANPDLDQGITSARGKDLVAEWVELHVRDVTLVTLAQRLSLVEFLVVIVGKEGKGGVALPGDRREDTI